MTKKLTIRLNGRICTAPPLPPELARKLVELFVVRKRRKEQ